MIWYEIGGNTHLVWSFIGFLTLETVLPSNIQVVLEVLELTCLGFGNRESGIHLYFCTSEPLTFSINYLWCFWHMEWWQNFFKYTHFLAGFLIYHSSDDPGASCTEPLFFFVSEKYDIWLLVALGWQLVEMNWSPEGYKNFFKSKFLTAD
jgi:hypothetical protein